VTFSYACCRSASSVTSAVSNTESVISLISVMMHIAAAAQGPDLQNILRQSYDYLTIMPKFLLTYDKCLIYKISYDYRMKTYDITVQSYNKQRAVL